MALCIVNTTDIWHCEQLQKVQHHLHDSIIKKEQKSVNNFPEHTVCKFMSEATDHWQAMQASSGTILSILWHRDLLSQT